MAFFTAPLRAALLLAMTSSAVAASSSSINKDCSCGYYDSSTTDYFTDSIIVYFNETESVPSDDFIVQSYENRYEKGWNTQYRQGAILSNVNVGNSTMFPENQTPQTLELYCNNTTPDHLVQGGGIRTSRQDIFFGSFRASLRGTPKWVGGSALSMQAFYNETQSWQLDNINPNPPKDDTEPSLAWVSMISHSQFPDRDLGVNYTTLEDNGMNPWNWTEYRVDWLRDELRFYIGGKLFRKVTRAQDPKLPTTPAPIFLKHWSTGNFFSTQGPPAAQSVGNVEWIRLFFNSSLTTAEDQKNFSSRCKQIDACSIGDMELRGSSATSFESTLRWEQVRLPTMNTTIPRLIAYTSISATGLVLLFAFLRRFPWSLLRMKASRVVGRKHRRPDWLPPVIMTGGGSTGGNSQSDLFDSKEPRSWATPGDTAANSTRTSSITGMPMGIPVDYTNFSTKIVNLGKPQNSNVSEIEIESSEISTNQSSPPRASKFVENAEITIESVPATPSEEDRRLSNPRTIGSKPPLFVLPPADSKSQVDVKTIVVAPTQIEATAPPPAKVRIDYLAGLVGMSCLLVTAVHFCLTFAAASINPDAYVHNQSEVWARKTVGPYFLNLNWIGPFLMTSTRFLVSGYLKNGKSRGLAEKTVGRPFRLLIPIAVIAIFEYFCMDSGATSWLEYLASVTWSTWPFTTVPKNFGNFISEILQLAYLIPNAAPQITFNYCTGVLWTIPVQLQGSWTTIMAVIMIREIKTPWKRFCFYAWCVGVHWYALSWGTYFYFAIMLTDLELTYDWKKWLYSHRAVYYPLVISFALLAFGGLTIDLITQWTNYTYATYEYGVHPDIGSGRFIKHTPNYAYPQYYVPKLNGLVFSVAFQAVAELSPLLQKFLSMKFFTIIFPHVYTIYLIHGFIFWSIGSILCVYLSIHNLSYSVNVTIVALVCYTCLALSLPIMTPVVETLGKNVTNTLWQYASEEPAPRRATLYPFPADILKEKSEEKEENRKDESDIEKGELSK